VGVFETQLQAGAGYRFVFTNQFDLEVALLLGALWHRYTVDDPTALDRKGNRFDFLATLPVLFTWRPLPWLGLALRIAPGFSEEARAHTLASQTVWRREAYRIEAGASLVLRFR
jgi:hypothetical protein